MWSILQPTRSIPARARRNLAGVRDLARPTECRVDGGPTMLSQRVFVWSCLAFALAVSPDVCAQVNLNQGAGPASQGDGSGPQQGEDGVCVVFHAPPGEQFALLLVETSGTTCPL